MVKTSENNKILNGNQLKLIAMVAMTCDHVGLQIFPQWQILRIIGRLALPIYAFLIAEGCYYTRNKKRYLLGMVLLAAVCQVVFWIAQRSLFQCILVTFGCSIAMIYSADYARTQKTIMSRITAAAVWTGVIFVSMILPKLLPEYLDFAVDYGIWGILLPVAVYFAPKDQKLLWLLAAMLPLSVTQGGIQWYSFLALPLLLLYNGRRGKAHMKYLFYIYYPAHLAAIYLISILIA